MRLRAKLTVRNDAILSARERLGYTQSMLAELAGVSVSVIQSLERMDFRLSSVQEAVPSVAGVLGIDFSKIMPENLAGVDAKMDMVRTCDMPPDRLIAYAHRVQNQRIEIESHEDAVILKQTVQDLMEGLNQQQKTVVTRRYLEGKTLEEAGRELGITRERVRQVEAKALRVMSKRSID